MQEEKEEDQGQESGEMEAEDLLWQPLKEEEEEDALNQFA